MNQQIRVQLWTRAQDTFGECRRAHVAWAESCDDSPSWGERTEGAAVQPI
jgi:hypothetical protein